MKPILSILVVLAFAIRLPAQGTHTPAPPETSASTLLKIGAGEADKHYDQEMIVTGRVAQVTLRPKVKFLNLDRPYPNSPFTVVIFPGTYLADAEALNGKAIEIKGTIRNYHDKPEIVLDNTNQLTVLGSAVSTNVPPPFKDSTNFPEIM